jgi:hypothetical protein
MMPLPHLLTVLLALPVAPSTAAAVAPSGPAEIFAADITARARLGWRLRGLEVREHDQGAALALTMASPSDHDGRALQFVLHYTQDRRSVRGYRVESVPVPAEQRVYPVERDLIALFEHDAPQEIYEECGSYYLETRHGGIGIDAAAYYVVTDRVSGYGADQALAQSLTAALEEDLALTSVSETGDGAGHLLDLELVGATRRVLHVGTDQHDRVILLEVRESPDGTAWQRFRGGRALLETARRGRAVRTLALDPEPDSQGRLIGAMLGGYRLEVSLDDFELGEGADGCGC